MSGIDICKTDGKTLISAFGIWVVSAAVLLGISACILYFIHAGEEAAGYASSALSFAAAFFAGAHAVTHRGTGALFTGLLTGITITIILLTIGFIAEGSELSPDGVLSVVTFSLTGCIAGCVLFSGRRKKVNRKIKPQIKK